MNIIFKNTSRFCHHHSTSSFPSRRPHRVIVVLPSSLFPSSSPSCRPHRIIFVLPSSFPSQPPILLLVASSPSLHCRPPIVIVPTLLPFVSSSPSSPPHRCCPPIVVVILIVLPCRGPPSSSPRRRRPILPSLRSTNPEKKTLVIGNKEKNLLPTHSGE
jgi:hypothetical protein